ncbi:MAG TPA: lyase family protein, partial [Ignavibacteriaceae bacterium]
MEKSVIREFLNRIELFKDLDDNQLQSVVDKITVENFPKDKNVFTENNNRENLSIIYEGEVELFKTTPYGGEKRLSIFGKYDFLGEGALMDDSPHSTSARATVNSVILRLSRDKFKELMVEHNDVAMDILSKIARVISRRMSSANTRSVNLAAQYQSGRTRSEHDLLGDREVPNEVYYGIQTLRAIENFMISGVTLNFHPVIIQALAMVKMAAAKTNNELGLLSKPVADAIVQACNEIINGKLHTHFIVDMIQGGAGTSTNMNANEVIANRALEILGYEKGDYKYCHPNNHVNLSQSTNDAYPTSVKIALILANQSLIEVLKELIQSFHNKGKEFSHIIKMGRTQLQDAVPMSMGQEFEAYAVTLGEEVERLEQNVKLFLEVNMGATAIGTGINSHPDYSKKVVAYLREITKMEIVLAHNLV